MLMEEISNSNRELVIPVHPALQDMSLTVEDCYKYGLSVGVSPEQYKSIIQGISRPEGYLIDLMRVSLGDRVEQLVHDYDPLRWYEIDDNLPASSYASQRVSAENITPGSRVYTTDGRWMKVSKVEISKNKVTVYSGGTKAFSVNRKGYLIAAVSQSKPVEDVVSVDDDNKLIITRETKREINKRRSIAVSSSMMGISDEDEVELRSRLLERMMEAEEEK